MPTVTLYRPVGPAELQLVAESAWTRFPPRLPEQPIFYPVLTLEYADQITRQWNVPQFGAGHVTEFEVDAEYLGQFEVRQVGGAEHRELWVPAEELDAFNAHIRGPIRVVRSYPPKSGPREIAEFVTNYQPQDEVFVSFSWNGEHAGGLKDFNGLFRRAVCEHFRSHKADTPLALIAALYTAETQFAREAWGVHPIVSELAQELLDRGGAAYADVYFAGMCQGMDAYLETGRIKLSDQRRDELLAYCVAQQRAHAGTAREKDYEMLRDRFAGVPGAG